MGIKLDSDDQPTRGELIKIRGEDLKPVPTKSKRTELRKKPAG
jgi:hypothetical protein